MVRESIAILLIGLLLISIFLRSRHFGYALGVLPISIIPLTHLIIHGILFLTNGRFFGIRPAVVTAFADILGLVVSCAIIVLFSMRIQSRRNRTLYLITLLVYNILVGWVYIFSTISVLFA